MKVVKFKEAREAFDYSFKKARLHNVTIGREEGVWTVIIKSPRIVRLGV